MFIIREDAQVQFGQFPQIQKEGNETRRGEARRQHTSQDARSSLFLALRTEIKRQRPGFVRMVEAEIVAPAFQSPCSFLPSHHHNLSRRRLYRSISVVSFTHDTIPTRIGTEIKIEIGARHMQLRPGPAARDPKRYPGLRDARESRPSALAASTLARRIRAGTHRRLQIVASRRPMGSVPAYPRVHLIPPSPAPHRVSGLAFAAPVLAEKSSHNHAAHHRH